MLLLLTTSAFAQWQFAYTQTYNYTFYSVNFPSSTVGYIVGSGGVIFKSTDGGSTWTQQTSPTTTTLYKVFFTDDTHGFAVGDAGTIIHTTDGTNWTVHPQSGVITTKQLATVWFVGSTGWIAGGADNVKCEIYKTTDGGTTFSNVTVTNPSTDYCTDISFYDANLGYASLDGNGIMYTSDGGVNWTKTTLNLGPYPYTRTDMECIRATGPTSAVAGGWGSMVGPQPTILVVSTDSGLHFTCPNTSYPWATYGYGYGFSEFGNGEVIFMGGSSASAGITITSTDLATWNRMPAFYWQTFRGCCVVPGTDRVVAVGEQAVIALSTDRGNTWSYPVNPGTYLQGFCYINGVGANKVFAVGVGSVYFQINAATGAVKPGIISPLNWGAELEDIEYVVNPWIPPVGGTWGTEYNDVVYASGKNAYFCKSIDAGQTWTQLDHAASNFSIYWGMHWFDPDTGVVVGCKDDGANHRKEYIWRTTDGGTTLTPVWSPQLAGTNNEWNGVAFAPDNPAIGVAVGDTRYVVYTSDRGYHWTQGTTNIVTSTINILRVVMINSTTGYAIGTSGTLIKTTDAGHTWQVQTVPWGTTNLWGITYDTPNRLWVSGADQMCYYTKDGGTTWTSIPVSLVASSWDVKSVYYQGAAGILWVGTEYGSILDRTDQPVTGTETPKTLPYVLNQNYPNPFNPSTTIEFAIASDSHVGLNVYDVTGRLVATVLNKDLKAGKYTVAFKADKLATGVYFYKLTTSKGEETRKMVIIR
jgi:photosystem II stability/assembly factor-like uncharacterized protein